MDAITALRTVQTRFSEAAPELPNGFAEHATMGAEALLALGVDPEGVVRWAVRHDPHAPGPHDPGLVRRRSLLTDLESLPWDEVVRRELEILAPRVDAHLFHGLIRTAHAVRGLRSEVDDVGLGELATALAAWHGWAGTPSGERSGSGAAEPLEFILDAACRGAGSCSAAPSIFNLHAVTAPMAFLLVADLLDDRVQRTAAAAFGRTHARHVRPKGSVPERPPGRAAMDRLVEHWDAHPAKLTEAALRGYAATGDGVFLGAVEAIMGPWPNETPSGSTPTSSPPGSV